MEKPNKEYGSIRLPQALIEELKLWREAYINAYKRPMTYEFLIRGMIETLKHDNPLVQEEYEQLFNNRKTD